MSEKKKQVVVWLDNPYFTFNNLKKLYTIKYDHRQETHFEFLDRYDELVTRYNIKPYRDTPFSDNEKKETFYEAIKYSVPEIMTMKFLAELGDETRCTYELLRTFFIQIETQKENMIRVRSVNRRCYRCQKIGHIQYHCPERRSSFLRYLSNKNSNSKIERKERYTKRPYDY